MIYKGFIGAAYEAASVNADCQTCVNLYPEVIESGTGKNVAALYSTPGLAPFSTPGSGPIRAMYEGENRLFVVSGSGLYEISVGGSVTSLGSVGDDAGHSQAQIFANGNDLLIISAGIAYFYNGTGSPTPATYNTTNTGNVTSYGPGGIYLTWVSGDYFDSSYVGNTITVGGTPYTVAEVYTPSTLRLTAGAGAVTNVAYSITPAVKALSGCYLDGYYIVAAPFSKQFFISRLNQAIFDGLEFGVKEGYPDNINRVFSVNRELWLFGSQTTEVWQNTGNADFPFERIGNAFLHVGCIARWSVCQLGNSVAWLGTDSRRKCVAYIANGFTPQRISNSAIEAEWDTYVGNSLEEALAYSYIDRGHEFWVISFPGNDATWVYDLTTQMWHQRGTWTGTANGMHRSRCHAFAFNRQHIVGDNSTGALYDMSDANVSDAGTAIHWERTAPHLSEENGWKFYSRLWLDMQTGLNSGTSNITLTYSNDNGHTYSSNHVASAGATGDYRKRVIWRRLGRARDRVFRVTGTVDTVQTCLVNAYLDVESGIS